MRVLESCYRPNSFIRAANELGIRQGAVSQQIWSLEQRLGFAAFLREGCTTRPTQSGEALVDAVREGFGYIAEVIELEKRKQCENERVISVLPGFAGLLVQGWGRMCNIHS
ncbi:MAG: LysR family transcriptional regulator [Marinobacterium sp.]|nr:LysR family transcriptional regulator [Marinobacterium sp.]